MSIKSAWIGISEFDSQTAFCIGCLRIRDACKGWQKMKNKHRDKILDDRAGCAAGL